MQTDDNVTAAKKQKISSKPLETPTKQFKNITFKKIVKNQNSIAVMDDDEEEEENEPQEFMANEDKQQPETNANAKVDFDVEQYPHASADIYIDDDDDEDMEGEVEGEEGLDNHTGEFESDEYITYNPDLAPDMANIDDGVDENGKRRKIRGPAFCELCNKTFPFYSLYRNHMIKHSNQTPYECRLCQKRFKSRQAVRYHLSTHQRTNKNYACSICQASYIVHNQYLHHMMNHESPAENIYPCNQCGFVLNSAKQREAHLNIHAKERPFKCQHCEKRFRLRHHLTNHAKLHQQYKCEYCNNVFVGDANQQKPIACQECMQNSEAFENNKTASEEQNNLSTAEANETHILSDDDDDDDENDDNGVIIQNAVDLDSDGENADDLLLPMKSTPSYESYNKQQQSSDVSSHSSAGGRFNKKFKCKYCHRAYSHLSGLNFHVRDKHF